MGHEHFVCRSGVAAKVGEDGIYENWPTPLATALECAWPEASLADTRCR
jgi:hypothetical protein